MFDAASVLGYGAIGLGLLLAILAYQLLRSKSVSERSIYVFEGFCLILVFIGAVLQYTNSAATATQNQDLQHELQATKNSLAIEKEKTQSSELGLLNAKSLIGNIFVATQSAFPNAGDLANSVSKITNLVTQSCSDGPHGSDPDHAEEIRSIAGNASQRIVSAQTALSSIAQSIPQEYRPK